MTVPAQPGFYLVELFVPDFDNRTGETANQSEPLYSRTAIVAWRRA